MGALAASAVTINKAWEEGTRQGALISKCFDVTLVLTGQGTTTNSIAASLFGGISVIREASVFATDGSDHLYVAGPSYDGSKLLLKASATDAPADITDTVRGIVKGY